MLGIEIQRDPVTGTLFPSEQRRGHQLTLACRERGIIVRNIGDVLVLMPAPAMPLPLVDQLAETVTATLRAVMK